jgi:hypothetical protein
VTFQGATATASNKPCQLTHDRRLGSRIAAKEPVGCIQVFP